MYVSNQKLNQKTLIDFKEEETGRTKMLHCLQVFEVIPAELYGS